MRILLVEDEKELVELLSKSLQKQGCTVDAVADGEQALQKAAANQYDVMALDIGVPSRDGISLVKHLRSRGILTPVIFMTGGKKGPVESLDAGADDYLAKPFSVDEFLARIRALARRPQHPAKSKLMIDDLEIDVLSRCVSRKGQEIVLTNTEFELLKILTENAPNPVPKDKILEYVWGNAAHSQTNSLNVHIKHLRDKIEVEGQPELIITVRRIGFALRMEEPQVIKTGKNDKS